MKPKIALFAAGALLAVALSAALAADKEKPAPAKHGEWLTLPFAITATFIGDGDEGQSNEKGTLFHRGKRCIAKQDGIFVFDHVDKGRDLYRYERPKSVPFDEYSCPQSALVFPPLEYRERFVQLMNLAPEQKGVRPALLTR